MAVEETPFELPRLLVEFILLGPEDDRRQLQDSPILGDVWVAFAKAPGERMELLITPHKEQAAGTLAHVLSNYDLGDSDIAYLQGVVAARLTFEEVLRFVVPMTHWWNDPRISSAVAAYLKDPPTIERDIKAMLDAAEKWLKKKGETAVQDFETRKRYIALAGLILWANGKHAKDYVSADTRSTGQILHMLSKKDPKDVADKPEGRIVAKDVAEKLKEVLRNVDADRKTLEEVLSNLKMDPKSGLVWSVSINRRASPALVKSVPAIKADAARTLFTVDCSEIKWAVVDSGIDATHPAFRDRKGSEPRIERSFDFTRIREIISLDNLRDAAKRRSRIRRLLKLQLKNPLTSKEADAYLKELAQGAREGRPVNWKLVERLVEIKPKTPPPSNHGTHVAGILAADKGPEKTAAKITPTGIGDEAAQDEAGENGSDRHSDAADGVCPDIRIYDFRVLAPRLQETEFAVIAALQYIRYVNERNTYLTIHGANLSLSIPHDVRNYACGRTPVCNECERLVNSGVVVVAAAGNRGYQNFETTEGLYEGYAAFSVTDPGNADGVITVGATHRFWPHTYGVSFFSSRGPTGDGRIKPDLVAPGERIRAPLPNGEWGDLDGTSMAAPHVSGAAAMLMARYSELIGQPRRIKQILCSSATDLGRERSFQGNGMLDVLRAFQSI